MGEHLTSVDLAVETAGLGPVDAPLVALVRALAKQMDAAGEDGPGTRLAGSYLTAVRTLTARCAAVRPSAAPTSASPEPVEAAEPVEAKEVPGGDVLAFRKRARGRRKAG